MSQDAPRTLADYGQDLTAAVEVAFPAWMLRRVVALRPDLEAAAVAAAATATADLVTNLRELLAADVDEQRSTPMQLVRRATAAATGLLADAATPPVHRDPWSVEADPEDRYDLRIASWEELGPEVADAGLVWGAAKAHAHLRRRADRGVQPPEPGVPPLQP